MAPRNFFEKPNALSWVNYYGSQEPQVTMRDFTPQQLWNGEIPVAGQTSTGNAYQRVMSQLPPDFFVDDKSPTSNFMRWSIFRDMYENDPGIIKQRGEIYGNIMNELADKANARAMQGHLFAGLLSLPKQFATAAERRLESLPYQLQVAQPPQNSSFVTRQYATVV